MLMKECNSYLKCSAPLCPLDENIEEARFFPVEEICTQYNYAWIRTQRKIAKKTKDATKYFTLKMFKRNCQIKTGIKGLDPDREESPQLKIWMRKHPEKKKMSDEKKQELREKMKKVREARVSK